MSPRRVDEPEVADEDPGNDGDAIRIAEGTYRPTAELTQGEPRIAAFSLLDGALLTAVGRILISRPVKEEEVIGEI